MVSREEAGEPLDETVSQGGVGEDPVEEGRRPVRKPKGTIHRWSFTGIRDIWGEISGRKGAGLKEYRGRRTAGFFKGSAPLGGGSAAA